MSSPSQRGATSAATVRHMDLDGFEIVMTVEDRLGVSPPDARASNCHTVGDLAEAVMRQLPPLQPVGPDISAEAAVYRERVVCFLRQILADQMGVPMETIRAESRFVQELGID